MSMVGKIKVITLIKPWKKPFPMAEENGFFKDINELVFFPKEGVYSTVLSKTNGESCTLMCLAKGTELDEHTSTKTGKVLVLKGKGSFQLGGKSIVLKPGIFIAMAPNATHALKAEEDLAVLLFLNKPE